LTDARDIRLIPTEEAFSTPEQMDAMQKVVNAATGYDPDLYLWDILLKKSSPMHDRLLDLDGERLEIMDKAGIDLAVLSLTSTGVQMMDPDTATAVAITANDRLADAIARQPGRYAGLATVPPQAPEAAVAEVERAISKLGLNGVVINSHTDGEFLDEPKYWPILEAIEDLAVPLYVHPRSPNPLHAAAYRKDHLEHAIWGYAAETGLHALRLITGGVFDEFPKLKIILGHMGEGIPYWLYRIDYMHEMTKKMAMKRRELKRKPSEYFLDNFVITTSGVNWNPPLEYNVGVLGADRIMFAVDYPYQETFEAVHWMREAPLSEESRRLIFSGNAERLFGIPPDG
jgi:5-carboxyvanillate decarboxylase